MTRLLIIAALALASPALAQPADPHAGHDMAAQADPHAGHDMSDETPPAEADEAPPPVPADHDADRYFPPAAMAAARHHLVHEHGAIAWSKASFEKLEWRPGGSADAYAWEGRASFGGDINRLVLASRGEGDRTLHKAEIDVLYSRAVSPYFNLEAGLRQDVEPRARTYLAVGLGGAAPYGFELDNAVFVAADGDLTARLEAAHDLRLTQRLILEPRAEANLSAQDIPALGIGSGLSSLELGLRLRFAVQPQFAPYIGVNYERRLGATARLARAAGEDAEDTRAVIGLRSWF